MAVPNFSKYTYKISYKDNESAEEVLLSEELRIIEAKTNIIDGSGASVEAPNPNYDFFMTTLTTKVEPKQNVILLIKRNVVRDGETIVSEEQTVYTSSFNFLDYDRRVGILFTDSKVGETTQYKILAQILNINDTERIPCKYVFTGVDFNNVPSEPQHIDIAYKAVEDTDWISLGTNLTVPSTGVLDGIELGELPDDKEYMVKIYHREQETEKTFQFRTNIVPTIGKNPIIGLIEWNGRIMLLDAPDVKARMYPSKDVVNWMFPMDYSTKSFDNILSSLWTSDGYETNNESYHFEMRTSADNQAETYIGCAITANNYIGLPIDYVNEKLPDLGASMNIHFKDLFVTESSLERKTIFMKFFIDTNNTGTVKLLNFDDGSTERFIGFTFSGDTVTFNAFGQTRVLNSTTGTIQKGKWYTIALVCNNKHIIYASISDYSNYANGGVPVGSGANVGNVDSKAKLYSADRLPVTVELTYNATSDAADSGMGLCIDWATYQYEENTPENNQIEKGKSDYAIISAGTGKKSTLECPNESGYGIAVGSSLSFLYGGTTANGSVTITDIKVNGVSKFADVQSWEFNIDSEVTSYLSGTRTELAFLKTGNVVSDPVGGILLENITLGGTVADNAQPFIGKGANMNGSSYVVSRVGLWKSSVSGEDSWKNPYQYLDSTVFEALGGGYKKMPKLVCVGADSTTNIPTSNMTEMKDATVRFLLEGLPVGEVDIKVMSGEDVLSTNHRTIKSVKLTPAEADYDIDFENSFDNALVEFKKRYYAKQKRWGGNMGGGTHGALIYFNRKDGCLILEQHGDKYNYKVPAVAPAGSEGYGLPVDIIESPSSFEYPLQQRCTRVGGLIQSVDYHPYGMFDCWFQVPKGMTGLAICLWYFHYQEIYSYDKTFEFWTETGVNGFNYKECVKTGYGATWVVINNEIDMELGSENTPYRTNVNPNTDQSIYWYVPGLSMRQAIGCTAAGSNYGTWILDWEASQSVINSVTETDPQSSNSYLRSYRLTWVHDNDKLD